MSEDTKFDPDAPCCPDCGCKLRFQEGCKVCPDCGYNDCVTGR